MDNALKQFVSNLRCPLSGKGLREMDRDELEKLNASILRGTILTQEGKPVKEPLQEGLITENELFVYPVIEGYLAGMLPEQAISTRGIVENMGMSQEEGRNKVKEFYDEYGWQKEGEEGYNDTLTFEDRRPVCREYWSKCHLRLNKFFKHGGKYLLDVASGAIPNDEYLTYSRNFQLRICMDFSVQALREAAKRLDGRGIFILGDMTCIPLKDNCMDGLISLHTVYHVPQAEQSKAVAESFRVIMPGRQAVIVYSWKEAAMMKLFFGLWRPLLRVYQKVRNKKKNTVNHQQGRRRDLFVQQQNYDWFSKEIKKQFNARLLVYSGISRSFSQTFLREKWMGKEVGRLIYFLEDVFPSFFGRWGQYPVFVLQKPFQLPASQKTFSLPFFPHQQKKEKNFQAGNSAA